MHLDSMQILAPVPANHETTYKGLLNIGDLCASLVSSASWKPKADYEMKLSSEGTAQAPYSSLRDQYIYRIRANSASFTAIRNVFADPAVDATSASAHQSHQKLVAVVDRSTSLFYSSNFSLNVDCFTQKSSIPVKAPLSVSIQSSKVDLQFNDRNTALLRVLLGSIPAIELSGNRPGSANKPSQLPLALVWAAGLISDAVFLHEALRGYSSAGKGTSLLCSLCVIIVLTVFFS